MKGLTVSVFAALLACCIGLPSPVVEYEVKVPQKRRVRTFKFSNCMAPASEMCVVNSLVLQPDPLVFPGPLSVSFKATFKDKIDTPLKAVVDLYKKFGSSWIKIPCIGQIGSCTYDDLCQILSGIYQCPDPLVKAGVPCKCPFAKNVYSLPLTTFNVDSDVFPPGDYHGQAHLTMNGQAVGCYDIMATFE
ncbi:hypothetical protein ACOMHN_024855 [Nucella lapillus]